MIKAKNYGMAVKILCISAFIIAIYFPMVTVDRLIIDQYWTIERSEEYAVYSNRIDSTQQNDLGLIESNNSFREVFGKVRYYIFILGMVSLMVSLLLDYYIVKINFPLIRKLHGPYITFVGFMSFFVLLLGDWIYYLSLPEHKFTSSDRGLLIPIMLYYTTKCEIRIHFTWILCVISLVLMMISPFVNKYCHTKKEYEKNPWPIHPSIEL